MTYRIQLQSTAERLKVVILFYLLLLQNPLSARVPALQYMDEAAALAGCLLGIMLGLGKGSLWLKGTTLAGICALLGFLITGLMGNILWQYQPVKTVLVDLYTNLKFFLALLSGAMLLRREQRAMMAHAKFSSAMLFIMLLLDQFFHIFPSSEIRYGMRVSQLIYAHPTYLAGAMVFLLGILTADFEKKNGKYVLMCLAVLIFTFRGKAMAGAAVYCAIVYLVLLRKKKLKVRQLLGLELIAMLAAGDKFAYYYIELQGQSARSVLTRTAFKIMGDYFPVGTGFGTYGSHVAANPYSPVYVKYGFRNVYELGGGGTGFFDDTFWPIIMGQTGVAGTVCYITVLALLFGRVLRLRKVSLQTYCAGTFLFLYLIISTTSEPAFNNAIAVPMAMLLGHFFTRKERPGV